MEGSVAAAVTALRPAIEQLVISCAAQPEGLAEPSGQEEQCMQVGTRIYCGRFLESLD